MGHAGVRHASFEFDRVPLNLGKRFVRVKANGSSALSLRKVWPGHIVNVAQNATDEFRTRAGIDSFTNPAVQGFFLQVWRSGRLARVGFVSVVVSEEGGTASLSCQASTCLLRPSSGWVWQAAAWRQADP